MHILDALKAFKGDFEKEKDAHIITMGERDEARTTLQPALDALEAAQTELALIAGELGVEYPAEEGETE